MQESWKERFTISDYLGLYHPFLIPLKIFPTSFPCFPRIDSLEKSSSLKSSRKLDTLYIFKRIYEPTPTCTFTVLLPSSKHSRNSTRIHKNDTHASFLRLVHRIWHLNAQIFDLVRYDNVTRFRSIPFSNRGGGEYRSTVGCQEVHSEIKTTSVRPLPGDFNCG